MFGMSSVVVSLLFILGGILGGVCGAALTYWGLERLLVTLSYRLTDLEDRLIREIKARAGHISQDRKKEVDKIVEWAEEQVKLPGVDAGNTPLQTWRRKFGGK